MVKKEVKKVKKVAKTTAKKKTKVSSESKNSESAAKKPSKKEIQNKQVMWVIILMVSVILIIFLVPYITKNVINKFEHIGLDFYKTKAGNLHFFTTKIPLINAQGFPIGDYKISFRNDPRELESIETIIPENKVEFEKDLPVYISIPNDAPICDENIIAVIGLTDFLDTFGTLNIKSALHGDFEYEVEYEIKTPIVTCETNPNNTVLMLNPSNETRLERVNKNCYEIQYKDCEIDRAVDKFILTIMEEYMRKYVQLELNR